MAAPGEVITVTSPATGEVVGSVPALAPAGADRAVAAAVAARQEWAQTPVAARVEAVLRLADALEARADDLVAAIVGELGQPERFVRSAHVLGPIEGLRSLAGLAEQVCTSTAVGASTVDPVPLGVVVALTPWNYPLHQVVAKVGAALLAGCTVVLKPSELAPLTAVLLGQAAEGVLPPGALGVVTGRGPELGPVLAGHVSVDAVSFTGSVRVGREVAATAGAAGHRVMLELGGKSAAVVLDDVDDATLDRAVRQTVAEVMANAGQTCNAPTRLVVPRAWHDRVAQAAAAAAERYVPGARLGPLVSPESADRVVALVEEAVAQGALVVAGGGRVSGMPTACWVEPTVLAGVTIDHDVAGTEVFGPVLCVMAHDGDADALAVAEATVFGLSASVWSSDLGRAERLGRAMRVGQVRLAGAGFDVAVPFGGFKDSGFGREWGAAGIAEHLTTRAIVRPAEG